MNLASKESPQSESSAQQPMRVQTEYSRALGDWLISQQVALVCSTYLAGYLLFIGVRSDGLGANCRELSIPIEDIKSLEVRRYSPRYGSIYLERYKDLYETLPRRPVTLKQGRASIWSSSPMSWPPLTGFYGFRNYDAFARLIVDLRAGTHHFIQSEDFGGLDG